MKVSRHRRMQSDRKNKIKILAIEEEISRLELQLIRENTKYLGTIKRDLERAADVDAFEKNVLNPIIKTRNYSKSKLEKNTLLGFCKQPPKAGFMEKSANVLLSYVSKNNNPISSYQIITTEKIKFYLILAYDPDDDSKFQFCIKEQKELSNAFYKDLKFTYLWNELPKEKDFFQTPIDFINERFDKEIGQHRERKAEMSDQPANSTHSQPSKWPPSPSGKRH